MPRRAGGAARRPGCCAGGQDCALLLGSGGPIRLGPHGRTRPARARQSAAFPPAASRLQGRSRPGRLPGQPFRVSLTRIAAAMPRQAHGPTGQRDPCWQPATGFPPGVGVPMVAAAGPPASPKQVRPGGLLRTRLRARAPTPPSRSARARLSARVVRRRGTARGPASGLAGIAGLPAAAPRRRRRESLTRRARPASPDGWRAPRRRFASQEGGRPGSWPSLP